MKAHMRLKALSLFLIVTACPFLAQAAGDSGPSGSGGGKGAPQVSYHVYSEAEMPEQIVQAESALKFALYSVEMKALDAFVGIFEGVDQDNKVLQRIYAQKGSDRISQLVDRIKINIKLDGYCNDPQGHSTDASFNTDYPNEVCISPSSLANTKHASYPGGYDDIKIDSGNALSTITSLLAHEMYHYYTSDENEAKEFQVFASYAFPQGYDHSKFESHYDDAGRDLLFGSRIFNDAYQGYTQTTDSVKKCSNIVLMMNSYNLFWSAAYRTTPPIFDPRHIVMIRYTLDLLRTLDSTCGLNSKSPYFSLDAFGNKKSDLYVNVMNFETNDGTGRQVNQILGQDSVLYRTDYLDFKTSDLVLAKVKENMFDFQNAIVADAKYLPGTQQDLESVINYNPKLIEDYKKKLSEQKTTNSQK